MPLTDIKIRSAKPREKTFKLFDSGGLYLEVSSTGGQVLALEVPLRQQGEAAGIRRLGFATDESSYC